MTPQIIQSDRVNAVRDIALQTGAITVLKGPGTLIAMRSSRTWLSPYATASLATAGSGDVLSGMIASFLGQRYDTVESVLGATVTQARNVLQVLRPVKLLLLLWSRLKPIDAPMQDHIGKAISLMQFE